MLFTRGPLFEAAAVAETGGAGAPATVGKAPTVAEGPANTAPQFKKLADMAPPPSSAGEKPSAPVADTAAGEPSTKEPQAGAVETAEAEAADEPLPKVKQQGEKVNPVKARLLAKRARDEAAAKERAEAQSLNTQLEQLQSELQMTRAERNKAADALKSGKMNEFAKAHGFETYEAMSLHLLSAGDKPQPVSPEVKAMQERLQELEAREAERVAAEEARQAQQAQLEELKAIEADIYTACKTAEQPVLGRLAEVPGFVRTVRQVLDQNQTMDPEDAFAVTFDHYSKTAAQILPALYPGVTVEMLEQLSKTHRGSPRAAQQGLPEQTGAQSASTTVPSNGRAPGSGLTGQASASAEKAGATAPTTLSQASAAEVAGGRAFDPEMLNRNWTETRRRLLARTGD